MRPDRATLPGADGAALADRVRAVTTARVLSGRVATSATGPRACSPCAPTTPRPATPSPPSSTCRCRRWTRSPRRTASSRSRSAAADPVQHLRRPDLGRRLGPGAREVLLQRCPPGADLQVLLGDGLSASAVAAQVPGLLPLLLDGAAERGWSVGQVFAVRRCRVGVLNEVGELLDPAAVVLLVGERPGLGTAESLSAYLAWRPRPGHTDADRNLVAGIHARGLSHADGRRRGSSTSWRRCATPVRAGWRSRRSTGSCWPRPCPRSLPDLRVTNTTDV